MAPELIKKKAKDSTYIDLFKADVWSLGVTLFQLCYKRLPFSSSSAAEYKKQILSEEIQFEDHALKELL